jgi:hypothetical protein
MHNGFPPHGPSRPDITPPSDPTLRFGPEAGQADGRSRADGLGRLSRLTWRTTQLGAIAAAAFAVLFARSAPAQTASSQTQVRPSTTPSLAASPTPSARHKNPHHKHNARHAPVSQAAAQPSASAAAQPSSAAPTLAPPTTPPAAAPSPSPVQSTSSGTHSGG